MTKQLLFVETNEPNTIATVEKLHAEAVLLHSKDAVRLSSTTDGLPVLDVYGHVLADKVRGRSDARLKTDIRDIQEGLDTIKRLCGKTFQMNGTQSYGVIAQEVQQVIPEIVSKDDQGYLTVHYLELIPFLIEAVKSLDERIAYLLSK